MTLSLGLVNPWNTFIHTNRALNIDSTGSKITIYSNSDRALTGIFNFEVKFASSYSKYGSINFEVTVNPKPFVFVPDIKIP